jgi:hypothetical protein
MIRERQRESPLRGDTQDQANSDVEVKVLESEIVLSRGVK